MRLMAIFFDLDDTLLPEESMADEAFSKAVDNILASEHGKEFYSRNINKEEFITRLRILARELFHSYDIHPYCEAVGLSSWEALWTDIVSENALRKGLDKLKIHYQIESWKKTLLSFGIDAPEIAENLSKSFRSMRRQLIKPYEEAEDLLENIRNEKIPMALLSNGLEDLQHEKIRTSGVEKYFDFIITGSEAGQAKPHPAMFNKAMEYLNINRKDSESVLMVGNSLHSDIQGAASLGIKTCWINRENKKIQSGVLPDWESDNLSDLNKIIYQIS